MNETIIAITKHKEISLSNYKVIHQAPESDISDYCKLVLIDDSYISVNYQIPTLVIINDLNKIDHLTKNNIDNFIIYPFTKQELDARVHIAINRFYYEKNIRDKAYLDDLTELYNKKFLYFKLNELIHNNSSFAIIMIDIDNFSSLNLSYGHIEGDVFLKSFAIIMKKSLRNTDFAFRFGGEEFVIILKDGDSLIAEKVNQRLLNYLQESNLPFTISCGITAKIDSDIDKSILERADNALIKAKKEGKNRFCLI